MHRHFFLLQFARDEFIAKYSVKNHISPERLEQRIRDKSEGKYQPQFCGLSMKILEKADEPKSSYLRLQRSP